ncbi:NAD-dependent succinate-semialdehyde dehydrogenase [Oryzicola mucosus]|uniref:NAD-dependent succinate-semialdehyde dehydrogenase n=1 Tax=Oryzicola mucosus TaxID=2767425 RepID=A0A8J6PZ55_9HYPH|nr:NAD-dependent succinate-semialdehyde dehydrogenase [Oryzicola mucosus]MBD0417443.1 NAD-dependent succinate-semialdehyde dehydrogenase [Oryzicola mucosus]
MAGGDQDYPDVKLLIGNEWIDAVASKTYVVVNPATEKELGHAAMASEADLEAAVASAVSGFEHWRDVSPYDRSAIMRRAANLLRERATGIARLLTLEQGKPVGEAMAEIGVAADTIDWFAEEGRRAYGRVVPSRAVGTQQLVLKEPIGPVAAFTPWNFPLNQAARKIAAALAAGCSVVAKPAEETPACVAELAKAFCDAGLPAGVLNLVFGVPSEISSYLISHPAIRKISFTGSTAVGKKLSALAGEHMKRSTMELGGHAPVLVFADADVATAAAAMAQAKFRNAGQICISPTRFVVHRSISEQFADLFAEAARTMRLGDGLVPGTEMGPLASERRLQAVGALVSDAVEQGAVLRAGGRRHGNIGYFYEPTVLSDVPTTAKAMNEEPFGPVALIRSFDSVDEAIAEANRLSYGLAAFAYTQSNNIVLDLSNRIQAGMVSINGNLLALPELPFGGVKDSGYGSEGGSEAMEAYMNTKLVKVSRL